MKSAEHVTQYLLSHRPTETLLKLVNPAKRFISRSNPRYKKFKAKIDAEKNSAMLDETQQLSKERISQFKKITAQELIDLNKYINKKGLDSRQVHFDISMCYLFGWAGVEMNSGNEEWVFRKLEAVANRNFGPAKLMLGNLFYCWAQLLEEEPEDLPIRMNYFGEYLFESPLLFKTEFFPTSYVYQREAQKQIPRDPKVFYEQAYRWFFSAVRTGCIPAFAALGYMLWHDIGLTHLSPESRSKAKMIGKIFLERAQAKKEPFAKLLLEDIDKPIMGKPKMKYAEDHVQMDDDLPDAALEEASQSDKPQLLDEADAALEEAPQSDKPKSLDKAKEEADKNENGNEFEKEGTNEYEEESGNEYEENGNEYEDEIEFKVENEIERTPRKGGYAKDKFAKYKFKNLRRHWNRMRKAAATDDNLGELEKAYSASQSHRTTQSAALPMEVDSREKQASNSSASKLLTFSEMSKANGDASKLLTFSEMSKANADSAKAPDNENLFRYEFNPAIDLRKLLQSP